MARWLSLMILEWEPQIQDKRLCVVLDFQGITWSNIAMIPPLSVLRKCLRIDKAAPTMKVKIVAYNVPRWAAWFYNSFKLLIPGHLRHKINVVKGSEIEDIIPRENLPHFIVGGAGYSDGHAEGEVKSIKFQPHGMDPPVDCLDFDEAARFHGVDMDQYHQNVKPRLRQLYREEFAAFPQQFSGRKSVFLNDDY